MTTPITNNRFYQTFTPFISKQTPTAEKNIKGRNFVVRKEPIDLSQEFYKFLKTTGLLILPMLSIGLSRKSIKSMVKQSTLDSFRIKYAQPESWRTSLFLKIAEIKDNVGKKILAWTSSSTRKKDKITSNLNNSNNNEIEAIFYRGFNKIFKALKNQAAEREYAKVLRDFKIMEKLVNQQADIIEASARGNLRILFDRSLLKNSGNNNIPYTVDVSKTAEGLDRATQIRTILKRIKDTITIKDLKYSEVKTQLTYSCEDIFAEAELALRDATKNLGKTTSNEVNELFRELYSTLSKYRFAEMSPEQQGLSSEMLRKIHKQECFKIIEKLKQKTKGNTHLGLDKLKYILERKTTSNAMGDLEKLRYLLKCNDIDLDILKENMTPSLLKQYRTDDYVKTKQSITNFMEKLNFAEKTQSKFIDKRLTEVDRGRVFPHLLSLIVPACLLSNKNEHDREKAKNNKSILFSFLAGGITMIGSRYMTMWKKTSSVLCGLFVALLAPHIYNSFLEKDKKN